MQDEPETRLTEAEAAALAGLREPVAPSTDLESRVIETLTARRLLRTRGARLPPPLRPLLAAAAAILLFLSGRAVGQREITAADPDTAQFMILLFEDEGFRAPPPGREMERVTEYGDWARGLAEQGVAVSGDELLEDGVTIEGSGPATTVQRGIPETSAGRFAGYFVVAGADLEAAIGIARGTPHLRYGGRAAVVPLAGH